MEIREGVADLTEQRLGLGFRERTLRVYHLVKVAAVAELHHDVHCFLVALWKHDEHKKEVKE